MNVRMAVALLVITCAGCGAHPHNVTLANSAATLHPAQANHAGTPTESTPVDAALSEQACYAFSECRTTASGLGV